MPGPRFNSRLAWCIHSCVPGKCRNKSGNELWSCNGNPLRKHAMNQRKHPDCSEACDGFVLLHEPKEPFKYQRICPDIENPTDGNNEEPPDSGDDDAIDGMDDDFNMNIDDVANSEVMDVDMIAPLPSRVAGPSKLPSATPISRETSQSSTGLDVIDLNCVPPRSYHSGVPGRSTQTYRLIYVPDPTRSCTASRAEYDLAFLTTTISMEEWDRIKHLKGSVHRINPKSSKAKTSVFVRMQEWVRPIKSYIITLTNFLFKVVCYDSPRKNTSPWDKHSNV
jgi:hypothetical protein